MGKQMTEMLKGTLEGIVLAILAVRPAYGYEITAWLREQGFSDIAEGTVYALLVRIEQRGLVDVEKVPSEKGPPRKVYSLNAQGQEYLEEFWRTWSFLTERLEQLHEGGRDMTQCRSRRSPVTSATSGGGGRTRRGSRQLPANYRTAVEALERYLMYFGGISKGDILMSMFEDLADLFEQARRTAPRSAPIVGDDPVEFAETFLRELRRRSVDQQGTRAADQRHRPRRRRERRGPDHDRSVDRRGQRSRVQGWRSRTRSLQCCAAWTSTWRGAASSPCSARTGRARPRS